MSKRLAVSLIQVHHDEFVESLEQTDFCLLVNELCKCGIITRQVRNAIVVLHCDNVNSTLRTRYLLQLISDKVRLDKIYFEQFLRILQCSGRDARNMCESLSQLYKSRDSEVVGESSQLQDSDRCLTEQDIPNLVEDLSSQDAHKWEEISLALHIPTHVQEDCRNKSNCVLKLSGILKEWITGKHLEPVTIGTLKKVLVGPIVTLPNVAKTLSIENSLPVTKKPRLDIPCENSMTIENPLSTSMRECIPPVIVYQSMNTEVAYDKSTLLEVQVNCSSSVSYKWFKDGSEVFDGEFYQSTSSPILLVSNASQHVEGKYTCCVGDNVMSPEISLVVLYPKVTKNFLNMYKTYQEVPRDSWPPIGTETYVELALINREQSDVGEYDYSIRGNMDDIFNRKEKLEYCNAFVRCNKGALVLVEGRPGVGKTTLAHKITKDWTMGRHILIGAKVVLLISLRVLNSSRKDGSLSELIEMFYDKEVDVRSTIEFIESDQGEGVCFILDGLDEYQPYNNEEPTIISKIIERKLMSLSNSMVIVLSRPVGSARLRNKISVPQRIEILGFKREHIYNYIDKYFQSRDEALALKEYLKLHINVFHMCYLPVHAAMVCFIFKQTKNQIPTTETKIYECFTMLTIIQKFKREDKGTTPPTSFSELDSEKLEYFHKLCQVAFEMTSNSKQVFVRGEKDIQLTDSTGSDGPSLGLVTVDSTATLYKYNDFYTFLHLTFQEYLAAFHISNLSKVEQLKIIREQQCNGAMLVVWKFYCGMTDFQDEENLSQLNLIFKSDKIDDLHRVHYAFESQQVEVCNAALECGEQGSLTFKHKYFTPADFNAIIYVISSTSSPLKLQFYFCKLNKGKTTYCRKTVDAHNFDNVISLLFHDSQATMKQFKILNMLLTKFNTLEDLDLFQNNLSQKEAQILTRNVTLLHLKSLKILLPFEVCGCCYEILRLLHFNSPVLKNVQCRYECKTQPFYIGCTSCCDSNRSTGHTQIRPAEVHLSNKLITSNYPPLDAFYMCVTFLLTNCGIDDNILSLILHELKKCKAVEKLVLDYNHISDRGAVELEANLQGYTELKYFSAHCNFIGDSGAIALASALGNCPSLVHLDLECNSFGDQGAVAIAKATTQLNIADLYLWNAGITETGCTEVLVYIRTANITSPRCCNFSGINVYNNRCFSRALKCCMSLHRIHFVHATQGSAATLIDELKSFTNLQTLNIFSNDIRWKEAAALADALKSCTNLLTLDISNNKLGSKGATLLANGLKSCTNLQTLDVSGNNIDSKGAAALADGLNSCTNLQELNIGYNNIGSNGAEALANKVLMCCTNLQVLCINKNKIHADSLTALAAGLKCCANLQTLDVSRNSIGSEGAVALADGLKCCSNLQTLDIMHIDIDPKGVTALADGLKFCTKLKTLNVSSPKLFHMIW